MHKSLAAENIRRLAVQYQGMVEAADMLERLGSLEQHEAEVRTRLAAAQAELKRVRAATRALQNGEPEPRDEAPPAQNLIQRTIAKITRILK